MVRSDWLAPALLVAAAVTALRWALLAFNQTDLFVDEAQYWLWGQDFAFGYYSKPPLIAWLIGGVTWAAGSDAPFWIRMPGAALHGLTAVVLAACAAQTHGPRAAFWVAVTYVTLPFAALGSLLISTDSVMAPFFAAALYFHLKLVRDGNWQNAMLTGAMVGLACLAKYAGLYFLIGALVAALLHRNMRPSLQNWLILLASFAVMISPNLLWNLSHQFATFGHTMDNVGWVEETNPLASLNPGNALTFLASQFGVFGPITLAALVYAMAKRQTAGLAGFVLPVIAIVTMQALLDNAYANWALSAYFAGSVIAAPILANRPKWLALCLSLNGALCLALPFLTIFPYLGPADRPFLSRYLGRAALSQNLIAMAGQQGVRRIVTDNRDVIADLYYTGRDSALTFNSLRPSVSPQTHYQQTYPLPEGLTEHVLYIGTQAPTCPTQPLPLPLSGTYQRGNLKAYAVQASCLPTAP